MATTDCPECGTGIDIDADLVVGKRIKCQACQADLEVIWLFPLSLERADLQWDPSISNSIEPKKDTN